MKLTLTQFLEAFDTEFQSQSITDGCEKLRKVYPVLQAIVDRNPGYKGTNVEEALELCRKNVDTTNNQQASLVLDVLLTKLTLYATTHVDLESKPQEGFHAMDLRILADALAEKKNVPDQLCPDHKFNTPEEYANYFTNNQPEILDRIRYILIDELEENPGLKDTLIGEALSLIEDTQIYGINWKNVMVDVTNMIYEYVYGEPYDIPEDDFVCDSTLADFLEDFGIKLNFIEVNDQEIKGNEDNEPEGISLSPDFWEKVDTSIENMTYTLGGCMTENNEDRINPSYYTDGGMECIDEMTLVFGKEAVMNFCLCNVWKYRRRAMKKNGQEDLDKATWYMNKYAELKRESDM